MSSNFVYSLADGKLVASLQLGELKQGDGVSVKNVNMSTKRLDVTKKDGVAVDPVEAERREKVKDAMIHAWSSYEKYAWGHDELQVYDRF